MEEIVIVLQACCVVWLAMQYKRQVEMNDRMSEITANLLYYISQKGLLKSYEDWLRTELHRDYKGLLSEIEKR